MYKCVVVLHISGTCLYSSKWSKLAWTICNIFKHPSILILVCLKKPFTWSNVYEKQKIVLSCQFNLFITSLLYKRLFSCLVHIENKNLPDWGIKLEVISIVNIGIWKEVDEIWTSVLCWHFLCFIKIYRSYVNQHFMMKRLHCNN